MYIVIVGASDVGKRLTELVLSEKNHNVVVIDKNQERCEYIARKFDAIAINADASKEETLDELDVKKADVLIATTTDDAINLLVVSLAKNRGVKNLIAVVNQEESKPLYIEKEVKIINKPHLVVAEMIFTSIKHPNIEEYLNVNNYAKVIRIPLLPRSSFCKKTTKEIWDNYKSLIVAIERDKRFIIPTDEITLHEGDIVTIIVENHRLDKVVKNFSK
jgi:trk system potassium uptake protein TrkA